MKKALFLFLALLIVSCQTAEKKSLPFTSLAQGYYSAHEERRFYLINSASELEEVWNKTFADLVDSAEKPVIDFSNQSVIALFMGSKPSGGYQIKVSRVEKVGDQAYIYYQEKKPAGNEIVTMAFTQPYHLVKTEKINEVVFKKDKEE